MTWPAPRAPRAASASHRLCQGRHELAESILPAFGDRDFESVTRADVQALHASLRHIPSTANYVVNVVGSLYKRIITDWELSDMRHPTHGIKLFKMNVRERFLTPEERQHVHDTTQAGLHIPPGRKGHLEPASVWALQLLALTGMRRDEIRDLTWPMVDWQHACLRLPDTKTGQRTVAVSSQVMTLLRQIHDQTGNRKQGHVIASRTGGKLTTLNKTRNTLREAIGLPGVRLHDLRHSFASDALMSGVPLAIVGQMLGHRQAATPMRYAHIADCALRGALEQTTGRIVAANTSIPTVPVAPFEPMRDPQWARVAPLVDADRPRGGKPVDLRRVVDGIRWALHSKSRWRDLPAAYGKSTTRRRWYTRWSEDGTWPRVEAALVAPSPSRALPARTRAR
jgi:integrase/transposase